MSIVPVNFDRTDIHRTLPHSLEAEMGMLGSALISPADIIGDYVEAGVTGEWFYQPAHATIYAILLERWQANAPADVLLLTQILRDRKQLDEVGGAAFVTHLYTFTPTAANARYYREIVREKFMLRRYILDATARVARAYDGNEDVPAFIDEAEAAVLAIRSGAEPETTETYMKDQVMGAIETIEKLYERRGAINGVATGFTDFDRMTDGLHPAEMTVIAARPSMGKTALAMNIAEHVAIHGEKAVGVFSLEMSTEQLVQRLLCSRARVNLGKVRDGFLSERDFPNLTVAASKLAESSIHIDDTPALSINALRAKARRWHRKYGIGLVVIDYLQLMRSTTRRASENRQLEISEISSGIKALAKELKIPIIVLAQLNRNPEGRKGGRPKLSDLRESGSIEQDADTVGLLVREEYYAQSEEEKEEVRGEAVLDIAKQRNGPVGEVKLTFLKEFTRFVDRIAETAAPSARQYADN